MQPIRRIKHLTNHGALFETGVIAVTQGSFVLVLGSLKGMGRQAECEILAHKQRASESAKPNRVDHTYTSCSVIGAPPDLPDGEYMVLFDGNSVNAAKNKGKWFTASFASRA